MFKIYKGESVVAGGESPLSITGLGPNTEVEKGEYEVVRVEDDKESDRVDIPAFKTLPIDVESVTLSPKTSTGEAGTAGDRQLSAEIAPSNASNKGVTYSIDDQDGLTVSNSGKIDWTADVPAGDYTTAVTTDDGSHTDTHVLTLEEPVINVGSVELSPSEASLEVDETEQLTSTVEPSNADDTSVSYASDDEDVATVSSDGLVTAIGEGEATITVTTNDGNKTDTSTITVAKPEEEPDPEEGD